MPAARTTRAAAASVPPRRTTLSSTPRDPIRRSGFHRDHDRIDRRRRAVLARHDYKTYSGKQDSYAPCANVRSAASARSRRTAIRCTPGERPTRAGHRRLGKPPRVAPIAPLLLLLTPPTVTPRCHAARRPRRPPAARISTTPRSLVDDGRTRPTSASPKRPTFCRLSSPELLTSWSARRWSLRRYSQFIVEAITNACCCDRLHLRLPGDGGGPVRRLGFSGPTD